MVEMIASYWYVIIILLAGAVAMWLSWPGRSTQAHVEPPKIEPSAPKAVVDLAREMPKATAPVGLVGGAPVAKPVAKAPLAKPAIAKEKAAKPAKAPAKSAAVAPKPATAAKATAKPTATKVTAAKVAVAKVPASKTAPPTKVKANLAKTKPAAPAPAAAKAATAPKAKAAPVVKPIAAPKPAAKPAIPDNLELLKGVGPKLNTLLKSLGVTGFEQVANWSPADIDEIDARLGNFAGRIRRDNWVDQAKLLVAGDIKGFEKKYGALGSEITG